MKRIACPKCDSYITFDETAYPTGRVLVFTCPHCNKSFKVRIKAPIEEGTAEASPTLGTLTVIANGFQEAQTICLRAGENVIGRYVKGTAANCSFTTLDPSIDTTHCIVEVGCDKRGRRRFILRDAPSGTGTFYQDRLLTNADRIYMEDGAIITIGAATLIFNASAE